MNKNEKCVSANKYKGVKFPKCNNGNPCKACLDKWVQKHA